MMLVMNTNIKTRIGRGTQWEEASISLSKFMGSATISLCYHVDGQENVMSFWISLENNEISNHQLLSELLVMNTPVKS